MTLVQAIADSDMADGDADCGLNGSSLSRTADAPRVEAALNPLIQGACATPALVVSGPVASRSWSRVFLGRGPAYPTPVAIKLCLDPLTGRASSEAACSYFRALRCVHECMRGHPLFASARPYALFEDLGVVVAERVDGPALSRIITAGPVMEARLAARKAGAWLARLHRSTHPSYLPLDARAMLSQLDLAMTPDTPRPPAGVLDRARDALQQTAERATRAPVLWTLVHGDFKPGNMIVSNGKLAGIDVDLRWNGPGSLDAAQFLNHLALLFQAPRGITRISRASQISASFHRGYEQDGGLPLDHSQMTWVRLHNAVRLLLKHRDWSSRPTGWITGWCLRRLVAQLTDRLERAEWPETRRPADWRDQERTAGGPEPRSGRVAHLEDVLTFLAEDEDTWLSPDADRLVFETLNAQADRKD